MNFLRPIILSITYVVVVACCHPVFARQDTNPLLGMIDKKYSEYFDEYEALCDSFFSGDSLSHVKLVHLFAEAAAAAPTDEWNLDRQRIEKHVKFYDSRDGGYRASAAYTADRFAEDLLLIARTAQQKGFKYLWLRSLFNAADAYRIFGHDYELAFKYYLQVAAGLENVSQQEFPWKLHMYWEIAGFYASFREYTDAARFYRKITDDPDATYKNNHRLYPALSGLAECYRYAKQYERSDSCYQRILELSAPSHEDCYVWEGIAAGNIGYNYYLRGDMDKALAWMEPALGKMKRPNDDPFTSRLAAHIADIYLRRNDVGKGKKYLSVALDYHQRSRLPEKSSHLLEVQARYHSLQGNKLEATAYLDSTLRAKEREQEAYSGLVLRRVEQQLRAADQRLHEHELDAEKLRTTFYKHTALWVSGASVVFLLLLLLLGFYYRRTRQAYHELVLRSQQWAGIELEESPLPADHTDKTATEEIPDDTNDRLIMEKVEKAIVDDCLYKHIDLTLDMLVAHTGLNRSYLSGALNRCVGKNFNTYVNEYRVKEAIRLMSEPANANHTIEAIAFESGFNDRSNFYRTFKKLTGLSPTDFRKNLG